MWRRGRNEDVGDWIEFMEFGFCCKGELRDETYFRFVGFGLFF